MDENIIQSLNSIGNKNKFLYVTIHWDICLKFLIIK